MKTQRPFALRQASARLIIFVSLAAALLIWGWQIRVVLVEAGETAAGPAAPASFLLAEDFEEDFPPPGWTVINNGGDCLWQRNNEVNRPNYAGDDGFSAAADADACAGSSMDTELRAPVVDLSSVSAVRLDFVAAYRHHANSSFRVLASGDNGDNWDTLLTWTSSVDPEGPGQPVTLDLTPYAGMSEVMISFHYAAGNRWWAQIDQVRVTEVTYGVELTPTVAALSGLPGEVVTYTLTVTNTGDVSDTFTLAATHEWDVTLPDEVELDAGASITFTVAVTVPTDAAAGDSDTATITATSTEDPREEPAFADAELTTTADAVYGVELFPDTAAQSGLPGEVVAYTLTITNTGNATDEFTFTAEGNDWDVTLPDPLLLDAGEDVEVEVMVEIPAEAADGAMDMVTVTATSGGDSEQSASSELTTIVEIVYGVELSPVTAEQSAAPGETATYILTIVNAGDVSDDFTFTKAGNQWPVNLPSPVEGLEPGGSVEVEVTVEIPEDAAGGATDMVTVTATSAGDPDQSASSELTTTADNVYGVALAPPAAALSGLPGATVTYTLRLTNTGNVSDSFDLDYSGNQWHVGLSITDTGELNAGQGIELIVSVAIPPDAADDAMDTVIVTAVSQTDSEANAASTLTTSTFAVFDVALEAVEAELSGAPNAVVTYTLQLTNTGNATDTFNLDYAGNSWDVQLPVTTTTLAANENVAISLGVHIPAGVMAGVFDTVTVTAQSQTEGTVMQSVALTTTAEAVYGLVLSPTMDTAAGAPGQVVQYALTLTNTGNITDTYTLAAGDHHEWQTAYPLTMTVAPDMVEAIAVTVTIPAGLPDGAADTVVIAVTSSGDSEQTAAAALTTVVEWMQVYLPMITKPAAWEQVGDMPAAATRFYDVAVCGDHYLGGTDDGLYLLDTNDKWQRQFSITEITLQVAFAPGDCEQAYAATLGQGLWRGEYAGGSWSWEQVATNSVPDGHRVWAVAIRDNILFIGGDFGIRYAGLSSLIEGEDDWELTNITTLVTSLTHSPDSDVIYAAVWLDGAYVNLPHEDDATWHKQGELSDTRVYETAGGADGVARLAGAQSRLFLWNGAQWTPTADAFVNTTFAVAATENALYAGQRNAGVIVSHDGGQSWGRMMDGLTVPPGQEFQVRGFFLSDAYLYAATTSGVWRWPLP